MATKADSIRNSVELEKDEAHAAHLEHGSNANNNVVVVAPTPPRTFWQVLKYTFEWYPDTMSPMEKKLVKKLDATIISYGAIAFFLKYLDSSNIANAYVSGLKEEIKAYGNEYAWFGFFYHIGYMTFQIPVLLLMTRGNVSRYMLPAVELLWGALCFAQVRVTTPQQLYVIRFLLGAFAIPSYTGVNFVLGSWYKGDELFKRSATFMCGNSLGQMFSAYLQAGAYKNLNGVRGMAGWRWLFIIDGCITIPIAIAGFWIWPGIPSNKRIWWLSEEELELAKKRMADDGVVAPKPITWKLFKDVLGSWHIYVCVSMITIFLCETYSAGQMTLWLKSLKNLDGTPRFSIELINNIPTAIQAIILVTTFLAGSLAGIWNIWYMIIGIQSVNLLAVVILRIWTVPLALKWTGYFLLGFMGSPNPLFFGWMNRLLKRNAEERAIVLGACFCFGWAFFAWFPVVFYPTPKAPRWTLGYSTAIFCIIVSTSIFFLGGYLQKREEATRLRLGLDQHDKPIEVEVEKDAGDIDGVDRKEEFAHVEFAQPTPQEAQPALKEAERK